MAAPSVLGERRSHVKPQAPASGVIPLTADTALIGQDSLADGFGDFFRSRIVLNDYVLIAELRNSDKQELYFKLNELGDEAAEFLEKRVLEAIPRCHHIIDLTLRAAVS